MRITVRGHSMRPTVDDGAEVDVRVCVAGEARRGDVVLVLEGTQTVLHRLLGRRGDFVLLQGDGVRHPDAPLHSGRLLGIASLPRRPAFAFLRLLRARLAALARGRTWYGQA